MPAIFPLPFLPSSAPNSVSNLHIGLSLRPVNKILCTEPTLKKRHGIHTTPAPLESPAKNFARWPDGRLVDSIVVITEDAERCGSEQQMLSLFYGQPDPPGGEDAAKEAVGEECDISSQRAEAGN